MTENAKQEFKQWVKEKDLAAIRRNICSAHSLDPNGEAGDIEERLLLVTEGGITDEELYEEYQELNHPMTDDKTQWNKDYFNMHKVKLQRNFSKERLEHVRELGKFIFPQKQKVFTSQSSTNETQAKQQKKLAQQAHYSYRSYSDWNSNCCSNDKTIDKEKNSIHELS